MQTGLTDALDDVDADPGAVFEAHDADSVDELVVGGSEPATGQDDDVDALFADGLEAPSRRSSRDRPEPDDGQQPTDDVLAALERAAESAACSGEERDPGELDGDATDAEVEAAIVAAEEVYEGELPDEIPFE